MQFAIYSEQGRATTIDHAKTMIGTCRIVAGIMAKQRKPQSTEQAQAGNSKRHLRDIRRGVTDRRTDGPTDGWRCGAMRCDDASKNTKSTSVIMSGTSNNEQAQKIYWKSFFGLHAIHSMLAVVDPSDCSAGSIQLDWVFLTTQIFWLETVSA